jgi:hypothetical protein
MNPLVIRPNVFSKYGMLELAIILFWTGILVLFLQNMNKLWIVVQLFPEKTGIVVLGIIFWIVLLLFAARHIAKQIIQGVVAVVAVLFAGWFAAILVDRYHLLPQPVLETGIMIVLLLLLILFVLRGLANLLWSRFISFDGSTIVVHSLFSTETLHNAKRCWFQTIGWRTSMRITRVGRTTFGCEGETGNGFEKEIGRGWNKAELKSFIKQFNQSIKSSSCR